jgi:hypothetical protein
MVVIDQSSHTRPGVVARAEALGFQLAASVGLQAAPRLGRGPAAAVAHRDTPARRSIAATVRGADLAVLVAGATCALWLTVGLHVGAGPRLALLAATLVAHLVALLVLRRSDGSSRLVYVVGAVLLVLAVVIPPQSSKDLWSYAMQGRIIAVHHANPYLHQPSQFPSDPALARVASGWRHSPNPYGPAFALTEAGVARVAGGSALVTRLLFQGIEALGVVAIVLALRRRAAGAAATAFIVLSPAVVATVNGGHNDILVGACILGAVLLADRRRLVAAGVVLGCAALIKVTAIVAVPAIVLWLIGHGRRRAAGGFVAASLGVVGAGYLAFGGLRALAPVASSANRASRAALLEWPRHRLLSLLDAHGVAHATAGNWVGHVMTLAALVCVLAAIGLAWRRSANVESSATVVVPALVALICSMIYVLPWYALWVLPTAATRPRGRSTFAAWLVASALLVAYDVPPGVPGSGELGVLLGHLALPVTAVALVVLTFLPSGRRSMRALVSAGGRG